MNIGSLLSGAGRVSTGVREREDELRRAREDQLRLEAMNRTEAELKRAQTEQAIGAPPATANFRGDAPPMPVGVRYAQLPATPAAPSAGVRVAPAQNPTTTVGKVPQAAPAPAEKLPMTQAEFLALPPERRAQILQTINDRRLLKAAAGFPAAGAGAVADLATAPYRGYAMAAEGIANSRIGRALGITDPGQRMEVFGSGTASGLTGDEKSFPLAAKGSRMITDNMLPWTEEDYLKTLPATNTKTNPRRGGPARKKNAAGGLDVPATVGVEGFESQKAATRYNQLTGQLPAALQAPQTQQVISRAQQLGVDPVAAVTIFGIETTYGANAGISGKGAKGGMQVTDETFAAMKRWFADPANGATPAQQAAAAALTRGNPQSEIDAGLLRLKYNEMVGVPKPLWGAAYQAPAEKVRDRGAPLNASDGHFTNGEYHSVFVNLYNQVAGALGGMSPIATAEAGPVGDVSGAAIGEGGGSGVIAPAGVAPSASRAQVSPAQFYLNSDPTALTRDMEFAMQRRQQLAQMANMHLRMRTPEAYYKAMELKAQIDQLDHSLLNLAGLQGVREMEEMRDTRRLEYALSALNKAQYQFKAYTDDTYDLYINGQLAHQNVPGWRIRDQAMSVFDPQYAAQKAEMAKETHKGAVADRSEVVKQTAKMIADLRLEQFKGDVQMAVEYLKKTTGWDIKPDTNSGLWAILPPGEATPMVWDPAGQTIKRDGVEMKITGAQPIAGLTVGKGK